MVPIGKEGCVSRQVIDEYKLFTEDKLILISGSKSSGGFVVSRQGLICESIMKCLLIDHRNSGIIHYRKESRLNGRVDITPGLK
ncbi:MAG: hypothetical protein ABFC12_08070 [Methanobacterium sp.]